MLRPALLVFLTLECAFVKDKLKNVCDNPWSYSFTQLSSRCRYNPDVNVNMPELLTQHGYKVNSYDVTTEDGYILKVFNIHKENPKGVVYLQHPAIFACNMWVDKGNASLGLALSNAGFDVWMGNFRGTFYSRRHKILNPDKDYLKFWNFTFHEMGIYDLPAIINLVLRETKAKQVTFIGHSMAGTAAAIYASLRKQHAEKHIKKFILLAPGVFMENFLPIVNYFTWIVPHYYNIVKATSWAESVSMSRNNTVQKIVQSLCSEHLGVVLFGKLVGLFVGGTNSKTIDWEHVPLLVASLFGGMSVKTLSHLAQIIGRDDQRVPFYDYGPKLNQIYYNSESPPFYPYENINNSWHIFAGKQDRIVSYKDCENFYNILTTNSKVEQTIESVDFGHTDFIYSNSLAEHINLPMLRILSSLYPK